MGGLSQDLRYALRQLGWRVSAMAFLVTGKWVCSGSLTDTRIRCHPRHAYYILIYERDPDNRDGGLRYKVSIRPSGPAGLMQRLRG